MYMEIGAISLGAICVQGRTQDFLKGKARADFFYESWLVGLRKIDHT